MVMKILSMSDCDQFDIVELQVINKFHPKDTY
jgi:hypothetical protein